MSQKRQRGAFRLRVKIGGAEFEATGPQELVESQYRAFLSALPREVPEPIVPDEERRFSRDFYAHLMSRTFFIHEDELVSLRSVPPSNNELADAAVLLLLGFRIMAGLSLVPARKLIEGLRRSGLKVERLDRALQTMDLEVKKEGTRRGTKYAITQIGEKHAIELIARMVRPSHKKGEPGG